MRTTTTPPGTPPGSATTSARSGRLRRRGGLVAGALALLMITAACGGNGGEAPAEGGGAPPAAGPNQEPIEQTAIFGEAVLPPGTPGQGRPPVAIGSKNFAEQDLLSELYTQALQAKGYTITQNPGIGGTEVIDSVFAANQIQFYPEYLGVLVTEGAGQPNPPDAQATYDAAQQFASTQRQARVLQQTPFQNVDVIVVTQAYAQQFGLQAVPDLANVAPGGQGVRLAAQPEFQDRAAGLAGMGEVYGLNQMNPTFVGISAGAQVYQALDAGQADAGGGFTTDPQLLTGQYVQLADPENIFGAQYVAPVVKEETLAAQGAEFEQTANWVSSLLSVEAVQQMNQAVSGGQGAAEVAGAFLAQNGLQ